MEQQKSSLNPDAASYLPTHKQEATDNHKLSELTTEDFLKSGDETASSFSPTEGHCRSGKHFQAETSESDVRKNLGDQTGEQYINESQFQLDYLAFMFPDISENFLAHVYSINGGDVYKSIDMLKQLECPPHLLPECLPGSSNTGNELEGKVHSSEVGACTTSCDP
ncbi:uncharacterized protein LOC116124146 [Pistacia vera]|uniref:uncharacterized protein LOC116124146 n=1 Tax=Pistacia vera TaxID=55513 RepID=UPI001263361B|nr:uncharacterized protein LOC116124146 [Pistacia vera]